MDSALPTIHVLSIIEIVATGLDGGSLRLRSWSLVLIDASARTTSITKGFGVVDFPPETIAAALPLVTLVVVELGFGSVRLVLLNLVLFAGPGAEFSDTGVVVDVLVFVDVVEVGVDAIPIPWCSFATSPAESSTAKTYRPFNRPANGNPA